MSGDAGSPFPFEIDWVTLGAAGFLLVLIGGLGVFARLARKQSLVPWGPRREVSRLLLKYSPDPSEGYAPIRTYSPGSAGANGRLAVLAKAEASGGAGVSARECAIIYDGGRALFRILALHGPSGWRAGSSLYLGAPEADPVVLQDALDTDAVRDLARNAQEIVCLGLATSDAVDPPRDKTQLSCERAIHLGRALVNLGLARREQVIALALGASPEVKTDGKAGGNGSLDRAAVLIGLTSAFRPDTEADVIEAAADVLAAQGLRLAAYSLSAAPVEFWNIPSGAFGGFVGGEWEQTAERSYRGQ